MSTFIVIPLKAAGAILAADLTAGAVHWAEDAYIREDTPLIGRLIGRPNTIHHHLPRHMTRNTWWQSNWDLHLVMGLVVAVAALAGLFSWPLVLFAVVAANSNEVHKWSHRTRKENGRVISFLQDRCVLQTPRHHAVHHTNPKEVRYCPVTNVLNPVLDTLRVWAGLEWLLERVFGLKRRPDTSVSGQGVPPEWISELRRAR